MKTLAWPSLVQCGTGLVDGNVEYVTIITIQLTVLALRQRAPSCRDLARSHKALQVFSIRAYIVFGL